MGFLINNYSSLPRLMDEEGRGGRTPGDCSLYSFVLCDYRDVLFRRYFTEQFDALDRRTGANMLFLSLLNPEAEDGDVGKSDIDELMYQHALLDAFQVSSADLPAIVVTTSLDSGEWYVVHVADEYGVSHWLRSLGLLADDLASGFPIRLADELNSMVGCADKEKWYKVKGAPIKELLAQLSIVCQELKDGLDVCDTPDLTMGSGRKESIARLSKYLEVVTSRPQVRDASHQDCSDIMMALNHDVEPDTARYINIFCELYGNRTFSTTGDYSVLCSLLHKIFESEINMSVLQLMRWHIHIPMPEYYNRFFPHSRDCYVGYVNLNRYEEGNPRKSVSPGLGKACTAFSILLADPQFCQSLAYYGIESQAAVRLRGLWEEISAVRNLEAHCQVISLDRYRTVHGALSEFVRSYLPQLVEIKAGMKETDPIRDRFQLLTGQAANL